MSGTDWNALAVTLNYSDWPDQIKAQGISAITWLDSSLTADTNVPVGAKRWNQTNSNWEQWSGSAWVALTGKYSISISGNADSATNASQLGGVPASSYATQSYVNSALTSYATIPYVNSALSGYVPLNGAGAAGVWGISISGNATNATNLVTASFSIVEIAGKLIIKYGATTIVSISSAGEIIAENNVTAYGAP